MFKILSLFQSFEFSLVTLLFERWDVDAFPSCLLRVVSYRMTFTLKRKWKCLSCVWLSATPWTIQTMEFSRPDPGVSSLSLLQGTFPTQGSNPGLLHCRWILHQLRYQERNHKNYCETGTRSEGKILGFLNFFFFFNWKEFQRLSISSGHLAGLLNRSDFCMA